MAKHLFFTLAKNNVKRNKRMFLPYFIASSVMVAVFFMALLILYSKSIGNLVYGDTLQSLFDFCSKFMFIIVVPFMLYINSFIMKQRQKEFGLYGILGLEKRHVGRVIILENIMLSLGTLITGILSGCLFGKLIFMIMIRVLGPSAEGTKFTLPPEAFIITLGVFACIFIFTTCYNLFRVQLVNPIHLLKGMQKGERKPRFVIPLTLVGLSLLGWAYYVALASSNNFMAVNDFFLAAFAVIGATYLLFISGSVFFLNLLKRNKHFYYKPKNFITIGSLFHRMRQNAVGLATICILFTMVIVTVSITTAIYFGRDDLVRGSCPNDVTLINEIALTEEQQGELKVLIEDEAQSNNIGIENKIHYKYLNTQQLIRDGHVLPMTEDMASSTDFESDYFFTKVITVDDFNRGVSTPLSLEENEVILLNNGKMERESELTVADTVYSVKDLIADTPFTKGKNSSDDRNLFIVTADENQAKKIYKEMVPDLNHEVLFSSETLVNFDCDNTVGLTFTKNLETKGMNMALMDGIRSIYDMKILGDGLYGGFLFMGIFFAIVFLCAAIIIIYFKQVSEGFEDQGRFEILQKVGMSDREVKSTINRQILMVFFLPLIFALLHIFVATNIINQMLSVMFLENTTLTLFCIIGTSIVFAIIYIIVYRLTAKVYYRIVTANKK